MDKPIWMSAGDWQILKDLRNERSDIIDEYKELRQIRDSSSLMRMRDISKRLQNIDNQIRSINSKNPILPQNIVPELRLEKLLIEFWRLHDDLEPVSNLPPKERVEALAGAINIGHELMNSNHPDREQIGSFVQAYKDQLIYNVNLANEETELILEVSNSFGDQIVPPISQAKTDPNYKQAFVAKLKCVRPNKTVIYSFESRVRSDWDSVVQLVAAKIGS